MKRAFQIAGTVLFLVLILISLPFAVPRIFHISVYEVVSESMAPDYPKGSVVYVKETNDSQIKEGMVITFSLGSDTTEVMTHRVVNVDEENRFFVTKGDANADVDPEPVSFDRVIGVPVMTIPHIGALSVLFAGRTGKVLSGCLLLLVLVLWISADCLEATETKPVEMAETRFEKRKIILLCGICLILFSGVQLAKTVAKNRQSDELYQEWNEKYVTSDTENPQNKEWYQKVNVDLKTMQQENPDVVGWLWFENEKISYPLLYSGDDTTYLHTAVDGSASYAGSLFVEGANQPDFQDCHTIIYGHNMKDLSMFGRLRYYRQKEDYYKNHAFFQIFTEDMVYRYQIFAGEEVAPDSEIYHVPFAADTVFAAFIQNITQNSLWDTGVSADKNDKIVTLSTCSQSDKRFVVHAMRVGEQKRGT